MLIIAAATLKGLLGGAVAIGIAISFVMGLYNYLAGVNNKDNPAEAKKQIMLAFLCAGAFVIFSAFFIMVGLDNAIVQPDWGAVK